MVARSPSARARAVLSRSPEALTVDHIFGIDVVRVRNLGLVVLAKGDKPLDALGKKKRRAVSQKSGEATGRAARAPPMSGFA